MINLKAYAKLNLFLNITGKLDNGYHTLEMVMQSIDLFDSVSIEKTDGFCVVCEGIDMLHNSAYRAGLAFFQKADILPSAKISISKRIPVMAGLGGGSADAFGRSGDDGCFPLQFHGSLIVCCCIRKVFSLYAFGYP